MIISNVNIGSGPGFNDGESIYSAFYKVNQNFANVQSNVNSLTNSVSSVAGRTGNVTLTINDIVGLNTTYSTQANLTTANVAMRGYVDAKIAANVAALIDSAPGALDTLNELAAALNDDASFATTIVNTVTLANTIQSQQIAAANVGIIGYINNSVSSANLGMKGYVDSQIGTTYSNINVLSYLTTNSYATQAYVNLANTSMKSYVDGQIIAANSAITAANLGMKGYVDSVASQSIYGNANVASFLPTYTGNIKAGHVDFTGDTTTGVNGLFVGIPGVAPWGNAVASFHGNIAGDMMINVHNKNSLGQSVFLATADLGDNLNLNSGRHMLLGITSSGWTKGTTLVEPYDSSLAAIGGNLIIGAGAFGTEPKDVVFYTDGWYETVRINATSQSSANLVLGANVGLKFNDNTVQTSAYSNVQTAAYLTTNNYLTNTTANLANYAWNANVGSTYSNVQVATYLPTHTGNIQAGNVKAVTAYRFATGAVTITNGDSHVELSPDTGANALAGVKVGGGGYILGPNASRCITLNYGSVGGAVGLQANVTIGTGGSGNLVVLGNASVTGILTNNYYYANGTPVSFGGSSYSNVQVEVFTNLSNYAYNANVTAANVGMKGYVDSLTYSNVQAESFITTFSGNVPQASLAYSVNISPVILNQEYQLALLPAKEGAYGVKAADGTANVTYNPVSNRLTSANISATGSIQTSGINGLIGYSAGGFAQQATSNSTQVTSNTSSGNIQLMSINLGVSAAHTVTFACNKLTTNDMLLIKHVSGGLTSVYIDAYVASDGLAVIWLRNISGIDTGNFIPMLKYAIIRAPSA